MAKRPTQSYPIIHELLECLVRYAEHLTDPPAGAELHTAEPQTYRFVIQSPQDKTDAILKLLFGEDDLRRKRGPKGFRETDLELMRQLKTEMEATGQPMQALLDQYVMLAQMRSADTQDESIRQRLEDAYYALAQQPTEPQYGELAGIGFEPYAAHELQILLPWLSKYRTELIKLLTA